MIDPHTWFDHQVTLRRSGARWHGIADATTQPPVGMLVGIAPDVSVADGVVTLTTTVSGPLREIGSPHRDRPAAHAFVMTVGEALERRLAEGDRLRVTRCGSGDLTLALTRDSELQLALGALKAQVARHLCIENDRRVDDFRLQMAKRELARPGARLVWLDPADPQLAAAYEEVDRIKGQLWGKAHVLKATTPPPELQCTFAVTISDGCVAQHPLTEQLPTREAWLAYVEQLPMSRPNDLHIRFSVGETSIELREGAWGRLGPWTLCVHNVKHDGPGAPLSRAGVVRTARGVTADVLQASVRAIATRGQERR